MRHTFVGASLHSTGGVLRGGAAAGGAAGGGVGGGGAAEEGVAAGVAAGGAAEEGVTAGGAAEVVLSGLVSALDGEAGLRERDFTSAGSCSARLREDHVSSSAILVLE